MRSKLALLGILVGGACALSMGCSSSSSPTSPGGTSATPTPTPEPTPNPFSWSGAWEGTVTEATFGTVPADMDLDQEGSVVTGEMGIDFGGALGRLTGGAAGTVTDTTLTLDVGVIMQGGGCMIHLEGTRSESTVTGTLGKGTCTYPFSGTFSLTKG
jgi:hypothetical protein